MTNLDETLFRAINSLAGHSSGLDWLMVELGRSENLLIPGALLLGYWLWLNWRETLIAGASVTGSIVALDFLGARLKDVIARPRPCLALPDVTILAGCGKMGSFPSNHALNTATAAAFFQVLYPKSGWISWPLVTLIGVARVSVGAHYLTDVIAGWVIGGLFGAGAAWLLLQWPRFRPSLVVGKS
jgi:undecaprenyl-diphosphatase